LNYRSVDGALLSRDGETLVSGSVLVRSDGSAVIPSGVKKIGEGAFRGCSSLTSVVIPESVKKIGEGVFYGCSSLTSVVDSQGRPRDWR